MNKNLQIYWSSNLKEIKNENPYAYKVKLIKKFEEFEGFWNPPFSVIVMI